MTFPAPASDNAVMKNAGKLREPASTDSLGSSTAGEAAVGTVVVGDGGVTQSPTLNDALAKMARVFPTVSEEPDLTNELYLSSFLAANLLVMEIFISAEWVGTAAESVRQAGSMLLAFLSIPLAVMLVYRSTERVIAGFKNRYLHPDAGPLLAITAMAAVLFHLALFERPLLFHLAWDQSLVSALFLFTAGRYLQLKLFTPLMERIGFRIELLAPLAARFSSGGPVSAEGEIGPTLSAGSSLAPNDIIKVIATEIIPADGLVIDGRAQVAEVKLSGLPELRHKLVGDQVYAGSRLESGDLTVRVTARQEDSYVTTFSSTLNGRVALQVSELADRNNFYITVVTFLSIVAGVSAAAAWATADASIVSVVGVFASIAFSAMFAQMLTIGLILKPLAESSAFRLGALAIKDSLIERFSPIRTVIFDYRRGSGRPVATSIGGSEHALAELRSVELKSSALGQFGNALTPANGAHSLANPQWQGEVTRIEVIDRRVDEAALLSAIFALTGRATSAQCYAISNHLSGQFSKLRLLEVKDFHEYAGEGACALIEGCDVSIGNESFLLQRGVQMQQSELSIDRGDEQVLYVALNEEIIARVFLSLAPSSSMAQAVDRLRGCGIRCVLCSTEPGEDLDSVGKRIGLELADVYGGLQKDTYLRKVDGLNPAALFLSDATDDVVAKRAALSVAVFDELRWDLKRADVHLFSKAPQVLAAIVSLVRSFNQVVFQNFAFGTVLSLLLIGLGALGFITPAISLLAVMSGCIGLLLNTYRLVTD